MDLQALTDEELDQHLSDVQIEKERRNRLALIPAQVSQMAERYIADGGNPADLVAAIPEAPPA